MSRERLYGIVEADLGDKQYRVRPSIGNLESIQGTDIKRAGLTIGQFVDIIQCYNNNSSQAGWGFADVSYNYGSIFEPSQGAVDQLINSNPAQAAAFYLLWKARKTSVPYFPAKVLSVHAGYLMLESWGSSAETPISVTADLNVTDFAVNDVALVIARPMSFLQVIGWWQKAGPVIPSTVYSEWTLNAPIALFSPHGTYEFEARFSFSIAPTASAGDVSILVNQYFSGPATYLNGNTYSIIIGLDNGGPAETNIIEYFQTKFGYQKEAFYPITITLITRFTGGGETVSLSANFSDGILSN